MKTVLSEGARRQLIEHQIGYQFKNQNLLQESLTHKSYFFEKGQVPKSGYNERLEFLGDTVLNFLISDFLFHEFPDAQEGQLSQRRAALVSEEGLSAIALEIRMDDVILLGKGEQLLNSHKKNRMLACAIEALLGAVYLDGGFEFVKLVIYKLFISRIKNQGSEADYRKDFKTVLQEAIQKKHPQPPTYVLEKEEGPSHDRTFYVSVRLGTHILGYGEGRSKKQAEQIAAQNALEGKSYESY